MKPKTGRGNQKFDMLSVAIPQRIKKIQPDEIKHHDINDFRNEIQRHGPLCGENEGIIRLS